MTDNDATRKRHVADPLRLYTDEMYANNLFDGVQRNVMHRIADQIDSEHERRMEQQSYELSLYKTLKRA